MPKKVLVYGNPADPSKNSEIADAGIELSYKSCSSHQNLESFDAVIISNRSFDLNMALIPVFEKQITSFLRKGKTVCFTFFALEPIPPTTLQKECDDRFNYSGMKDIAIKYLHKLLIFNSSLGRTETHIVTDHQAFKKFVDTYATSHNYFQTISQSYKDIQTICRVNANPSRITAFSTAYFGGVLVFICGEPVKTKLDGFYFTLANALIEYSTTLSPVDISWLSGFCLTNEKPLRAEKATHENELLRINEKLAMYDEKKTIVGYKEHELEDNLPIWLEKYLGIHAVRKEKYKEDFFITDKSNNTIIIGESKSGKANLKHSDLSKIDYHRGDLGYEEDFPALLIANTFMNATSLKEKDQDFHPDIVKKAVADNVVIMRVLDLIRMCDYIENNADFTAQDFIQIVCGSAGWLKFTEKGHELLP